jgi:phage terminase large subunit-like protein
MAERYPHVNKANQYARDIVAGRIPACKWVRLACERHLKEIKMQKDRAFRWRFDREKADRVCSFVESLVHVKGKWAGEPLLLSPWQTFILACVIGWVDKKTGLRRFREAFIVVPRKNGKSALAAGLANYMFLADDEAGAEIYSGASTEKQAWEVFRPAKMMIEKSPGFKNTFGVEIFAKSMFCAETASRFEPIIGKPGDGQSSSFTVVDEYHQHDTAELYDTMLTGMGARTQPMMFAITTAGTNTAGPCKIMQEQVEKILNGTIRNDRVFGIIYTIDEEDDWTDLENWKKANPNYGISVEEEFLIQQLETAKQNPSKQNIIRCKHLNQWLTVDTAWMDMLKLAKCVDLALIPEKCKNMRCVIGLDLASKIDIAALIILFFDETEFYCFGRYYSCRATVDKAQNQHYQTWELEGRLSVGEGERIDFGMIKDDLRELHRDYEVECVAYDPWQATQLAGEMTEEEMVMVEVRAGALSFSEPMKELEAVIYSGAFHYNGDPVLTWMFANVVAHYDKKENIYPNKTREENKIDGVVALIMAMNAAIRLKSTPPEPEPGIIVI